MSKIMNDIMKKIDEGKLMYNFITGEIEECKPVKIPKQVSKNERGMRS
jgi:hypothetical protein